MHVHIYNHMHAGDIYVYMYIYMSTCNNAAGNGILIAIHVQMTLYTAHTCTYVRQADSCTGHTNYIYAMHA